MDRLRSDRTHTKNKIRQESLNKWQIMKQVNYKNPQEKGEIPGKRPKIIWTIPHKEAVRRDVHGTTWSRTCAWKHLESGPPVSPGHCGLLRREAVLQVQWTNSVRYVAQGIQERTVSWSTEVEATWCPNGTLLCARVIKARRR